MYLRMITELQLLWIQTFPKNFWKKDLYVRSSVKYRPCVRKPDSKLWIRSQYLMKVQKKQRKQKKRLRTVITLLAFVALLLAAVLVRPKEKR